MVAGVIAQTDDRILVAESDAVDSIGRTWGERVGWSVPLPVQSVLARVGWRDPDPDVVVPDGWVPPEPRARAAAFTEEDWEREGGRFVSFTGERAQRAPAEKRPDSDRSDEAVAAGKVSREALNRDLNEQRSAVGSVRTKQESANVVADGMRADLEQRLGADGYAALMGSPAGEILDGAAFDSMGEHGTGGWMEMRGISLVEDSGWERMNEATVGEFGRLVDVGYNYAASVNYANPAVGAYRDAIQNGLNDWVQTTEPVSGLLDRIESNIAGVRENDTNAAFLDSNGLPSTFDADRGWASKYTSQWADSAGDSDRDSVALQIGAANALGGGVTAHFEREHPGAFAGGETVYGKQSDLIDSYWRSSYAATQDYFAERGTTHVEMYRGIAADPVHTIGEHGMEMSVGINPVSSWSTDRSTAEDFAISEYESRGNVDSFVLSANVPVENIVTTPMTGAGCLGEYEFLVHDDDGVMRMSGTEKVRSSDAGWVNEAGETVTMPAYEVGP